MNSKKYQIALSYSSEDSWIAKDLYDLMLYYGYNIYCYDRMPDDTKGNLRANLVDIYNNSRINVLLWSKNYASKTMPSFPAMERTFLVNRHINKGENLSLIIVNIDNHKLDDDIEIVLSHNISNIGIIGIERMLIARMMDLNRVQTHLGEVSHPEGQSPYRTSIRPCKFTINSKFETDPMKRWETKSDILVNYPNDLKTQYVYLIPSGAAPPYLRHTRQYLVDPRILNARQICSKEFALKNLDNELNGFWFTFKPKKNLEVEYVCLYCQAYDKYLTENIPKYYKQ
jgi:hypothetical protein